MRARAGRRKLLAEFHSRLPRFARINFSARPRKRWKEAALLPQSAREREGFAIIQVAEACGRAGGLVGLVAYTLTRAHTFLLMATKSLGFLPFQ